MREAQINISKHLETEQITLNRREGVDFQLGGLYPPPRGCVQISLACILATGNKRVSIAQFDHKRLDTVCRLCAEV